jgi:hypothetical protein
MLYNAFDVHWAALYARNYGKFLAVVVYLQVNCHIIHTIKTCNILLIH